MQYKMEKITPAKALIILKSNPSNRTLKHKHVAFLAQQMIQGNWEENGQTIVIDANGNLIDGQHRLNALVQAEKTMTLLIVRGVSPKTINTIDTGTSRSAADTFEMNGIHNYATVSSIARNVMLWNGEGMHKVKDASGWAMGFKPSNDDIFKFHNKRKKDYQWASNACAAKCFGGITATQAGTAMMILSRVHSPAIINDFLDKIKNGGDYAKSPSHFLPQWVQKRKDSEMILHRYENIFAILYCFEKWLDNATVSGIRMNKIFDNSEHYYDTYNKNRAVKQDQEELELA